MFTYKYTPKNSKQVFGQDMAVSQLKDYIVNYKQQKMKAALLSGPIGCGKTSSVYALVKELNYDILEINSSDLRKADNIKSFLDSALGQQSLFMTPKVILVDEVDNISGVKDRGCIPALVKAIEKSSFPVILTANDIDDSKFKPLKKTCKIIDYHKLEYRTIAHCLQWVCEQEGTKFEERALKGLARMADGDMRGALIDLQIATTDKNFSFEDLDKLSDRKRTNSIVNALMRIFKSSSAENALGALDDIDVDLRDVSFWIDNNLPKEYTNPKALAKAYEHLARVDVFQGRIHNRQHWRFLVYMKDLMTAGISTAKDEKNAEFVKYLPTMRFLRIWQSKMKNAKKKEIAAKLASRTHVSTSVASEQIPYLQSIFRNSGGDGIAEELELSAEEVEWLRR